MKKLFLGILLSLFLCSHAYALSFGVNLDGDGESGLDTKSTDGYVESLAYTTLGVVDLFASSINYTTGDVSGTFTETAVIDVGSNQFGTGGYSIDSPEMTIVLSGAGTFSAETTDGSTFTNQAFTFTSGTLSIYIDDWEGSSTSTYYGNADTTDGSLYGADDGTRIATFDLSTGYGTLQTTGGQTDNVDIWSLSTTFFEEGYFFFEDLGDFAYITNLLAGIFIQMYTNDTNHVLTDDDIINALTNECDENDVQFDSNATTTIFVSSEGAVTFSVVPEPATMLLFGLGILGLSAITRKKSA